MSDTLATYRSRIRNYLREPSSTNSFWSNTFLDSVFNSAYRRRCAQLQMEHAGAFVLNGTIDIVAGTDTYNWPSGFQALLKIEVVRTNGTTVPLVRQERHYASNPGQATFDQDSYMPNYRPVAGGFKLEPKPTTSVTAGLRLEWQGLPAKLTADGDTLHADFPDIFDELLVLDTAVIAYQSEGSLEDAQGFIRGIGLARADWEIDWERYIESRVTGGHFTEPFNPHYQDA